MDWKCRVCTQQTAFENERYILAEGKNNASNLIGKRQSSGSIQGEPIVNKKANFGINTEHYE